MLLNQLTFATLAVLSLLGMGGAIDPRLTVPAVGSSPSPVSQEIVFLDVPPLRQSHYTSCGEAVLTMAFNYSHPGASLEEATVIEFARSMGYFTERRYPFTSPANMVKIAEYYTGDVATGTVRDPEQGLALLAENLQQGRPVILDVLVRRYQPGSGAHFILVTGISVDPRRGNAVMIRFNEPLTGTAETARWGSKEGVWTAWQNNGDPGGSGWWLALPRSAQIVP